MTILLVFLYHQHCSHRRRRCRRQDCQQSLQTSSSSSSSTATTKKNHRKIMDKNSSLRCLKFSLIAGNSAVIAIGLAGFLTGLVAPNAMQHLTVSGSQLSLTSSIIVVIGAAGLIGALRENFCLLLTYSLCLFIVFIFRLLWSLTAPLHQSGRFIMDTTASLTILSSLAKLFLMIFAILLALAAQNSLPLTKEKFHYLKDKFKLKQKMKKGKKGVK